ncbi:hypothetical protein B0J11DRAFT_619242, partial [Dendryphion nanum]
MARFTRVVLFVATMLEFFQAIVLLVLFACAYPDRFRTLLWRAGGAKGWNSDPHMRVYYYANYREPPPIPTIWDESTTQCNLCIAVVTVIIWIIRWNVNRLSGRGLDLYATLTTNGLYDILLIALWTYSAAVQSAGDFSDKDHLSLKPWYLQRSCGEAYKQTESACAMGKASYGMSVFTAVWFSFRLLSTCMYRAYLHGMDEKEK